MGKKIYLILYKYIDQNYFDQKSYVTLKKSNFLRVQYIRKEKSQKAEIMMQVDFVKTSQTHFIHCEGFDGFL